MNAENFEDSPMILVDVPHSKRLAFLEQIHGGMSESDRHAWLQRLTHHLAQFENGFGWIGKMAVLGDRVIAGGYCTAYPGRLAVLTGPFFFYDDHDVQGLVAALLEGATSFGADLVQAIIEPNDTVIAGALERGGMKRIASLYQMHAWVDPLPDTDARVDNKLDRDMTWHRYAPTESDRWIALLDATYRSTADCPELNGIRSTRDTLEGYLAACQGDASEWWLLRKNQCDIACLLLTKTNAQGWELTYMGVTPEARGHKLGEMLLQKAMERARSCRIDILSLAADTRNQYALALYDRYGFCIDQQVDAWIWVPTKSKRSI
ncbi:MAG: GNAT family N-acetyltransferase [Pirellulales bacterium]